MLAMPQANKNEHKILLIWLTLALSIKLVDLCACPYLMSHSVVQLSFYSVLAAASMHILVQCIFLFVENFMCVASRLGSCPFSLLDHSEDPEKTDPFFMLEPSKESNGCFLAVLNIEVNITLTECSSVKGNELTKTDWCPCHRYFY